MRNEVDNATLRLLRESVVPLLQSFSCGGMGWRRVAYLNMSDPSQQCPLVWREIATPHRVCGRRSNSSYCEGLNYSTGSEQYDQVCGRIVGYQIGHPDSFSGYESTNIMLKELASHMVFPANTSGASLLVLMNRLVSPDAPVSLGTVLLLQSVFPHSWARTTSVSQPNCIPYTRVNKRN